MILLTVGTQLPFDRLVRAVDELAPSLSQRVFAQIGAGRYSPKNMESTQSIPAAKFSHMVKEATLIISHAGIGSVLTARRFQKPIVLYPRRAAYGEHRNDHQMATIGALRDRRGVYIAEDDATLAKLLQTRLDAPEAEQVNLSREHLSRTIADFIRQEGRERESTARGSTFQST